MKTLKNYCLWVTLFIVCNSCLLHFNTPTDNNLEGTWHLSDVNSLYTNSNKGSSFEEQADQKKLVKEGIAISFFEDDTYSELHKEGQFTTGQWKIEKENNTLHLYN